MDILRRWNDQLTVSMLCSHTNKPSKLYMVYLSAYCEGDNLRQTERGMGEFKQLEQLVGVGLDRGFVNKIVDLS